MGFLKGLFGGKNNKKSSEQVQSQKDVDHGKVMSILETSNKSLNELAAQKDARPAATEDELIGYFVEFFSPNEDFFSEVGSEKYNAYFNVLNAARDEMFEHPNLFRRATKWDISKLKKLYENPKPGITNMIVCGLIFRMGDYGVLKSWQLCVDFCESIPNCIAMYLLLTAQKLPEDQRKQFIDAGDGSDKTALENAMQSLKILDPKWEYKIY